MADAAVQLDLPHRLDASVAEALPAGSALRRRRGGTGFSVDTVAELLTELGRGAANGFAPLDSGVLVPRQYLTTMTGATSSTAGASGAAPTPAAGTQLRPMVGGAVYSTDVEVGNLHSPQVPAKSACRVAGTGDSEDYVLLNARGSGTRNARVGTGSAIDADVDLRFEPAGDGLVSWRGNPLVRRRRSRGRWEASSIDGSAVLSGAVGTPTEFGTPALAANARGAYREFTLGTTVGDVAGLRIPFGQQRRWNPSVLVAFEANLFLDTRLWVGMFSASPFGSFDPNTIHGFGLRFDATVPGGEPSPANNFRAWGCDGAGASTVKVLDGTSGNGTLQAATNTQIRLLFRNKRTSLGTFQVFVQSSADDATANEGDWTFLSEFDSATDKVPTGSTALDFFVGFERTQNTGSRLFRVKLVDSELF